MCPSSPVALPNSLPIVEQAKIAPMQDHPTSMDAVVIVGGGFGGLTAALNLSRQQPRWPVILIEPKDRFLFQPLLYELLSDELQAWEVAPKYDQLLSHYGINWLRDRVTAIDTNAKTVATESGETIHWHQLLIASGSKPHDFGIPGVREHALGFQTFNDVNRLRQRIRELQQMRNDHSALVIVGAGPTGVELACKLTDLLEGRARLHLVEMGESILPNSAAFNRERAEAALEQRGVTVHLQTAVTAVQPTEVEFNDERRLEHQGLLWTAGSRPQLPAIHPSPTLSKGRLAIDSKLNLVDRPDVFVIGDAARCDQEDWPSTAQVAMQQGQSVAISLQAAHQGSEGQPFQFEDRGEMLSLGLGDATLTGMGLTLAGPLAFQIRRATYLTRLPGLSLGLRSAGAWLLGR